MRRGQARSEPATWRRGRPAYNSPEYNNLESLSTGQLNYEHVSGIGHPTGPTGRENLAQG